MSRDHFKRDLEPYVCISDECSSNLQYFVSLRDWRHHMNSQHTLNWIEEIHRPATWFCETGDHDYQDFATEAELRNHLQATHSDRFNSEQQDTVVEQNVVYTSRGHDTCPLCGTDVARLLQNAPPPDPPSPAIKPQPFATPSSSSQKPAKQLRFDTPADPVNSDEEDYHEASDSRSNTSDADEPTAEDVRWRTNQIRLSTHVAGHLKSLAFTSLRYFDDGNDDSASQGSKRAASGDAGEKLSSERGHGDHYFELDELNRTSFQDIPRDQRNDEVEAPPPDPATTAGWAAIRTRRETSFAQDQESTSADPLFQDYPSNCIKPQESLSTRISREVTKSQFPRGSRALFAPRSVLDDITAESITQYFLRNPDIVALPFELFDKSLIPYVLNDARELFAICVAVSMPTRLLMKFLQSLQSVGMTDKKIPGCIQEVSAILPELPRSMSWSLESHQYLFQAPVLSHNSRHRVINLHDQIPLPIDFCADTVQTGGFGMVYKVRIHGKFLGSELINEVSFSFFIQFNEFSLKPHRRNSKM